VNPLIDKKKIAQISLFALAIVTFLLGILLFNEFVKILGKEFINDFLEKVNSPLLGLCIGIIATAIVQSSSLTTTLIVSMVASNSLSTETAVAMILGANIGTTITCNLIAFGHISNKKEYRRAVSAAVTHGMFNIIGVLIFFPLEYFFQVLSIPAHFLAEKLSFAGSKLDFEFLKSITNSIAEWMMQVSDYSFAFCLLVSLLILFLAIKLFSFVFKSSFNLGDEQQNKFFKTDYHSFLWGMGSTILIRSSTVTTSLIIPFVANKQVKVSQAFPFIMGANLGTTNTALLAGLASGGIAGFMIAIVHFLFNFFMVLIFFPFQKLRMIPLRFAKWIGEMAYTNRIYALFYLLLVYFILPFGVYFIFS
jgi:solute carrier family 34 (sodium-dependent phosphate cotransporter)